MKNIHILPTDKPCRLHFDSKLFLSPNYQDSKTINSIVEGRNIYITSNEEFKQGDWVIYRNTVFKIERDDDVLFDLINVDFRKIILTTDQDLMKDGVLAIDDEFLEWFVKNPSCEEVEVDLVPVNEFGSEITVNGYGFDKFNYKIIIPKEEPNQESLEEAAEKYANDWEEIHPELSSEDMTPIAISKLDFIEGVKWQTKRSYNEEQLRNAMNWMLTQYFEFHECPAMGRVDHYVQSIKSE